MAEVKLNAREAGKFFTNPGRDGLGILIFGPDAMRIAIKRQDLVKAVIGPNGADEMRLSRFTGAELRKDPARLIDEIKAQGFFPGPRVVLVEEASDGATQAIKHGLESWQNGDAMIIVTAGQLAARSSLRKLFEGHDRALAAAIYDNPASRDEIEAELARAGLADISANVMADLTALGQTLDPGDFRQTLEKIALYKLGDDQPLTSEEVSLLAPAVGDADSDKAISLAADGNVQDLGNALSKLAAQGSNPTGLCIALMRHFRILYAAASHPSGPEQALARARPPVFGPRRDKMIRQARSLGSHRLKVILAQITETDLALRSSSPGPASAMVERLLIRIAIQSKR